MLLVLVMQGRVSEGSLCAPARLEEHTLMYVRACVRACVRAWCGCGCVWSVSVSGSLCLCLCVSVCL